MAWDQIEATPPHLSYLLLSVFLLAYTLFATFIRNRLHLSEPPIAVIFGIILGPRGLGWLTPNYAGVNGPMGENNSELGGWGWGDDVGKSCRRFYATSTLANQPIVQEVTRVIVGIQVFAVGVTLPKFYASRHWKSVAMLLGPVMTVGWLVNT